MDIIRAKQIMTSLSIGIDPFTGELLYDDNICNHGETMQAISCILEELGNFEEKYSKLKPKNSGSKWTSRDDKLLGKMFSGRVPKQEFMRTLGRSESGIAARLVRLGLIDSRDEFGRRR